MGRRKQVPTDVTSEFAGIDLGDTRRETRARRLVAALADEPTRAFPKAVRTLAEREAAYRFLGNGAVTLDALLVGHVAQTAERARALATAPVIVIDKTSFVFGGETDREGLNRLGQNRQGFDAFFALAVSATDRMPLGVLAVDADLDEGRTSARGWLQVIDAAVPAVASLDPIVVADREADAFELFASLIAQQRRFVVRVARDRLIRETPDAARELLGELARRAPVRLEREVKLSRRTGVGKPLQARRKQPPRAGRSAHLAVGACTVTLPRPAKLRGRALPATLQLQLVSVREVDAPAGHDPVEWLLFTTLPIDDAAAVALIVDSYRSRWTIEEYFKALKSGCAYEQRQLESKHALLNALGLLVPIAWRLLALRTLAARDDRAPATAVFTADELHVLRKISQDIKLGPRPKAAEALLALARIGGHFPQNGPPGWNILWSGMQLLQARVDGYRLAKQEM